MHKCNDARPMIFPDLAGMRIFLGVTKKEAAELENRGPEWRRIFEYAADCRESFLARTMSLDNKRAQGCMNALKQPENGGYNDKSKEQKEQKLTIKFEDGMDRSDFE